MKILSVGLKYPTAPLEVREMLSFIPEQTLDFLSLLPEGVVEASLLSTCNRTEVYAIVKGLDERDACHRLISWLGSYKGLSLSEISPYFYFYEGGEAIGHLFRVTSGLDSLAFGEEQIQGQVRRALELSLKAGASKRFLSFFLREALRVGRRIRQETELGSLNFSVAGLALKLAEKKMGIKDLCLLIISAGSTAKLIGRLAKSSKPAKILITNRTFSKAQALAEKLGGEAIPFEQLPLALSMADVVISATSSPNPIVTFKLIKEVMVNRNHRPILLLDLAVPRDIDPRSGEVEGVWLYNIDDLQSEIREEDRMRIIRQAEVIIDEEVKRALKWWQVQQEVVPIIKALRQRAEQIRLREIKKTLKKTNLSEEERSQLDILTRSLVNKLLHLPTIKLKEKPERASLIKEIFDLSV